MRIKSITIILGLLIIAVSSVSAQHEAIKEFHREYKDHHDVHHIQLEGGIFNLLTWMASLDETDEEAMAFSRITKDLKGIDIVVVPKHYKPEKALMATKKHLKKDNFDELMSVREEGSLLNFFAQGKENEVRDMIIFIDEEDEYVILSLKGTLNLDDMKYLATHNEEWR